MKSLGLQQSATLIRKMIEGQLRSVCSESILRRVHECLVKIRNGLKPLKISLHTEIFGECPLSVQEVAIQDLRDMLEVDAKEGHLQRRIQEAHLLTSAGGPKAVTEAVIPSTNSSHGSRIDILTSAGSRGGAGEIIELKRASHRLIAYGGTTSARVSKPLRRAANQATRYGRLLSDPGIRRKLELKYRLDLSEIRLRLIAGRRLPDQDGYELINALRTEFPNLDIQSWDAFIAECERVF